MDKKMVFIYMDAVPDGVDFEKLTDKQVYYLAKTSEKSDVMIFSTMEEIVEAYNRECAPSDATWWGRVIDFSEFEHNDEEEEKEIDDDLLHESIAILSADMYNSIYKKLEGTYETASEIVRLAKRFEKELDWKFEDDKRDYLLELEKFEEKVMKSYK